MACLNTNVVQLATVLVALLDIRLLERSGAGDVLTCLAITRRLFLLIHSGLHSSYNPSFFVRPDLALIEVSSITLINFNGAGASKYCAWGLKL